MDKPAKEEQARAIMYDILSYRPILASEKMTRQNGRGKIVTQEGAGMDGMTRPGRLKALRRRDGGMEARDTSKRGGTSHRGTWHYFGDSSYAAYSNLIGRLQLLALFCNVEPGASFS